MTRARFAKPASGQSKPRASESRSERGYAWNPSSSISGLVRPLSRYAAPRSWMKRTGEREALLVAAGLSFPRLERTPPTTVMVGSTAFNAS